MAHPRSRGGTSPASRYHTLNHQRVLSGSSRQSSPGGTPRLLVREKVRPARSVPRLFREKVRPARHKPPILGYFSCAGRTFSRSHPPSGHAGRTFSRTRRSHVATMQPMTPLQQLIQASVKPPSPMLALEQQPLKPTSPLHPQTAPKTPISHPQRRQRFQLRLGPREQRRSRFQTSGPSGLQDPDAIPVGDDRAWPSDQWAADVTNVVKPTLFKSPRKDPCYKRRQSEQKNHCFRGKSPRIDDVCNAGTEIHTKNTLD